jgi:hypothetical protein
MKQRSSGLRAGLWVALAAVLLAAWFAPEKPEDGVVLGARPARLASHVTGSTGAEAQVPTQNTVLEVLQIRTRQAPTEEEESLFAAVDWQQREVADALPDVQAAEELPPPTPVAPPLPFRVMGRYVEGGQTLVFLQQADRNWIVREGDVLNESYKVESVKANAIHFKYLPLDEVQILETGGTP